MTTDPPSLVFGIQEESWPKGHGYLYIKRGKNNPRQWLCDLDLYGTNYEVVRGVFRRALEELIRRFDFGTGELSAMSVEVENMSSIARTTLLLEISNLCSRSPLGDELT